MKKLPLTNSKMEVLVDDDSYDLLASKNWYTDRHGHVYRKQRVDGIQRSFFLHRAVVTSKRGMDVDHIDGNKLNNQKSNLRVCTHAENLMNRGKTKKNTSGYKGVCWAKWCNLWRVRIKAYNKYTQIGYFKEKVDAARAYNEAAKKYHGEFAHLNLI